MIKLTGYARTTAFALATFGAGWIGVKAAFFGAAAAREIVTQARVRQTLRTEWTSAIALGPRLDDRREAPDIVEFSDYQCPFCRKTDAILDSIIRGSHARIAYHHMPLTTIHASAEGAARAAICAEEQGQFRSVHHLLMSSENWITDRNWIGLAKAGGIPRERDFAACLESERVTKRLKADYALAVRLGVTSTPAFFTKVGRLPGVLSDSGARIVASFSP